MHVGNLRTALFSYLLAKKGGGVFVLRIEDTDQARYVEGAVEMIYHILRETGLQYDEGPDVGGDYGPYVQSQRKAIYWEYAHKLINTNHAYYCFCDKERLDKIREQCRIAKLILNTTDIAVTSRQKKFRRTWMLKNLLSYGKRC